MNRAAAYQSYSLQNQLSGWTRIDMLIALYDRTIISIKATAEAAQSNSASFFESYLDTQKCLLAIHAGLKPEADQTAFNVARLLHYVSVLLEQRDFDHAIRILESLRGGFEAIREEATRLEMGGLIPPLEATPEFNAIA